MRRFVTGANVVGLGIGNKITAGKRKEELSLKFYLEKKFPAERIPSESFIPETVSLPNFVDPVPTDIEEIGPLQLQSYTLRVRPSIPGYSLGEIRSQTGTLGCLVTKQGNPNDIFILSNAHVLAGSGLGNPGDAVTQPGRDDGGQLPADVIATLTELIPFRFEPNDTNLCDIAIARLESPTLATSFIAEFGVPQGVSTNLMRGMTVQKTGRSTGHTTGIIKDLDFRTNAIPYPRVGGGSGKPLFVDQVLCEVFTAPGDSGSLICDLQANAVGVHWAGSLTASVFHKIQNVINALRIEIVTELI